VCSSDLIIDECFNEELSEIYEDYDSENIISEDIERYIRFWKDIEKENPNFTNSEIIKELEFRLDAEKFNL
jgi:hypothetical protein